MAHDLYLLAPVIIVMATAGIIILADLVLRSRAALVAIVLSGLALAAIVTASFIWRGERGAGFHAILVVDDFSIFFAFLFLATAAIVVIASIEYVARFTARSGEYYALMLISLSGMMLLTSTRDLIAIYVALETVSIPMYALAAFLKTERSTEAGMKYLLIGATSSAILLYGMAFLFGISGTTSLSGIAEAVGAGGDGARPALILAVAFLTAGFGFKMAVAPFHGWAPDVYQGAPTPVTAFLSVGSKAAGFAIVLRVFHEALGSDVIRGDWANVFAAIATVSMIVGNVAAIRQTDIKRMLGYSSIAQAGYFLIGVAAITAGGGSTGASAVLFFLAAYAFTNLGAFTAIIIISARTGSETIADFAGMYRRAPLVALAMAVCMFSLTGIPPAAGFIAKIYIFNAAMQAGLEWLVVIAVLNTGISAFYYIGVVRAMFLLPPASEARVSAGRSLGLALAVTTLGVLIVGVMPLPLMEAARRAASALSLS
ncbi:MAG: NADH-quinone oxidoreductase subunit N [Dehalococcoidia bacterium]|nr:NADH-quinone oxidoreductase subunit N [Dehalococcoidia bacterium]